MHLARRHSLAAKASSRTARAASRKSTACRLALKALPVCCPPLQQSISTAACRQAALPRVCRRIYAAIKARGISLRNFEAHISSVISLIISPSGPPRPALAKATNDMQALVASGDYDGVIWTQGSPQVEESAYWFNLLIDTTLPICGNAAQRPQGQISADGPANIVDSVRFIRSRVWADEHGRNRCGVVVIQEQQLFAAREVAKADARPGGYVAAGGHGGIIGNISHTGRIALTYLPVFKHTYRSDLKITTLPKAVKAAKKGPSGIEMVDVAIKDGNGKLLPGAIPVVTISADGSYSGMDYGHDTAPEIDLIASIEHKLSLGLLTGFVIQGLVPYGRTPSHTRNKLMLKAAFSGIPVAIAGRGAPMGFADPSDFQIAATNLTANKARFLLMACLMKFGSLPAAKDPDKPTPAELDTIRKAVAAYQAVFNEH